MNHKKVKLLNQQTKIFFNSIGGNVAKIEILKLSTFSSPDDIIPCINYYIEFDNSYIFGRGDYANEIYSRYRKMRADWRNFILKSGIRNFDQIAFGFIPLLTDKIIKGKTYSAKKIFLASQVIPIEKVNSSHFRKIKDIYDIKFALKEGGGMLIGPEGGMLAVLDGAGKFFRSIDCFVDIGAGTGELSSYLIKKYNVEKVLINDASKDLKKHLKNYITDVSKKNNVKTIFQFRDCRKILLPNKSKIVSLGVFYGFQPSFIKLFGERIKKILGAEGVLIIQSAMPEALFNLRLITGAGMGLKRWPWYSESMNVFKYFKHCQTIYIENQFVTLASQSLKTLEGVLKLTNSKYMLFC